MEMVGRDELPNAVGLNSVVMNSSRVVGPAIGGIVIDAVGLAPCFFVNAASYLAVLLALWMMNADALHRVAIVPRAKGQLREGFRYVWSDRMVRTPLVMMAVIGTLAFNFQVVIPLIVDRRLRSRGRRLRRAHRRRWVRARCSVASAAASRRGVSYRRLLGLTYAMGVSILLAAVAPTLATEVVALFVMGAASFAFIATANTTLQLTSRPEMRGRVMALYAIAFLGSTPVGSPIVGWICAVCRATRRLRGRRGRGASSPGSSAWLSFARMRAERDARVALDRASPAACRAPRDRATGCSPRPSSDRAAARRSGSRPNSSWLRRWRRRSQSWSSVTSSSRSLAGS